jgi:hypothetical protein
MSGRLYVEFCGEEHVVEPGGALSFGRRAQLVVDDNPYLHRVLGRFVDGGGAWRVDHLGRRSPIVVRDVGSGTTTTLAPGSSTGLVHGEFLLSFRAGPTNYELGVGLESHEREEDLWGPGGPEGEQTLDWARVELNADQRLLLVALCEARLVDPADPDAPIPGNRAGAARLGWTLPKFNRKLDHLCEKLHRAGVRGVHGSLGASADHRRRHLVEHALTAGLVSAGDLALLDRPGAA